MFENESDEIFVELGEPVESLLCSEELGRCNESKIGGVPVWFDDHDSTTSKIMCGKCSAELFHIAQIYAPLDQESHRCLYIFGCNKASCSLSPNSWRIFRTAPKSTKKIDEFISSSQSSDKKVSALNDMVANKADEENWSATQSVDDWCKISDETWGNLESSNSDLNQSLENLLESREKYIIPNTATKTTIKKRKSAKKAPSTGKTENSVLSMLKNFPCFKLDIYPEPWAGNFESTNDMVEKIQKYLDQEEDRNLATLLHESVNLNSRSGINDLNPLMTLMYGDEAYEKTPEKISRAIEFAERIKRAPRQVMRYAHGGKPLWGPSEIPDKAVPKCKCGKSRVFELQLMPFLLTVLDVEQFVPEQMKVSEKKNVPEQNHLPELSNIPEQNNISKRDNEEISGIFCTPALKQQDPKIFDSRGMEWGVVTVWTCPDSCSTSNEEYALIQAVF